MTVDIRLAGPISVEVALDGSDAPFRLESSGLPGRQGRLVLAALALRGEAVDRDELAHLLWPEELPGSWRVDLSAVVSKLRAALRPSVPEGQPIAGGRGWYRLDLPAPVRVDVVEAERALVEAEHAPAPVAPSVLDAVVAVTRQPFLPGDECLWVDERRAHQRRVHHRALVLRAELLGSSGAADGLVAAEAVVDHEPLDEAGYLLLGEAQLRAGDRTGAVRTIATLRARLAREVGLEPSTAAVELEQRALGVRTDGRAGGDRLPLPPPLAPPATGVVGRDDELADLRDRIRSRGDGLVLVAGEAGVGKTTLAAAAAAGHHEAGDPVLAGTCDADLGPMAGWAEALRRPARWLAGDDGQLPGDRRRWAPLARLVALGGDDRQEPAAGAGTDPDRERAELFEAVHHLLDALGGTPLVVLDDLHDADRPTLQLLEHLISEAAGVRLVATARRHELTEPPLRDLVARLRRDDKIDVVELGGLGPHELGELVDAVTGSGTAERYPRLVPALLGATAGNPLYVREALRHLVAGENLAGVREGSPLFGSTASPEGLEALIDANLARLGGPVRRLLEGAAIAGPVVEIDLVVAVAGLAPDDATAALDRAVHAGVLSEGGGAVRFTHPLVREVLVASLTASRRAALHRAVTDALADADGDPDETSVARHLVAGGAGPVPRPVAIVKAAGDRALAAFAYDEAVVWYQQALELAEQAAARPSEIATVLIALGDALNRAGRSEDAVEPLTGAVALARARRDPALLATAVLEQAKLLVDEGAEGGQVNARLIDMLQDALGSAPPPPPELRARLRARLAMELHFGGDVDRCLDLCRVAEEEARASGDPSALVAVLGSRHYALYGSPRVQERLAIASELSQLEHSGRPNLRLIRNYLELGDVGALRSAVTAFDGRLPRGVASDRWVLEVWRAAEAALEGRLADAEELAQRAVEVGQVSSRGRAAVEAVQGGQVFAVRYFQGRLGELAEVLAALAAATPERPIWRAAAALCHLQAGDRAGAAEHFGRVRGEGFERLPTTMDRPLVLAMLAWVGAEVGSDADVSTLLELLRPYEELMIVNGAAPSIVAGPVTFPLAVLAARCGDVDQADAWFSAAEAMAARWSARPWLALTELDHARLLRRAGRDRSVAGRAVEDLRASAEALAREVGMPHVVEAASAGWM